MHSEQAARSLRDQRICCGQILHAERRRSQSVCRRCGRQSGVWRGSQSLVKAVDERDEWPGVLVLNPDLTVAPDMLSAVVRYANNRKAMVTGRIARADDPARIHTRGLKWRRMLASVAAVAGPSLSTAACPPRLWSAPSTLLQGASCTSPAAASEDGLMEERYFLYFEDLDWGLRAKRINEIGYAFDAVVYHKGGTTIGSGPKRMISEFATYLNFRNRVLFVNSRLSGLVALDGRDIACPCARIWGPGADCKYARGRSRRLGWDPAPRWPARRCPLAASGPKRRRISRWP